MRKSEAVAEGMGMLVAIALLPSLYTFLLMFLKLSVREIALMDRDVWVHGGMAVLLTGYVLGPQHATCALPGLVAGFIHSLVSYYYLVRGKRYDYVSMEGKTVIVTGGNTGIGLETAVQLASLGAQVVIACRSDHKARDALSYIRRAAPGCLKPRYLHLDLCSLNSVRKFARRFKETGLSLNVLVNNAGVILPERTLTDDNIEATMSTNHFGHFLLTNLLLPELQKQQDARVINVTSAMHKFVHTSFLEDIFVEEGYSHFKAYNQSKLANVLFTKELARRVHGTTVTTNCTHPGIVMTEVSRNLPYFWRLAYKVVSPLIALFSKTRYQGSFCSVYLATEPSLGYTSGEYFANCQVDTASSLSCDKALAARLWEMSAAITHLENTSTSRM